MRDEVLVIGAGPAGIASAYYLEDAKLPYRVVDRAAAPASTWAAVYPSLQLNTAGFVSHLPGKRIPLRYGIFPMGRDYYRYICDYLRDHDFKIDYGVEVRRLAPVSDAHEAWCVETNAGIEMYRAVILAAGRFGKPYIPRIPGTGTFRGRILHAHDFRAPDGFEGERVMLVGSGPSAVDLAVALADRADVYLSVRSDILLARKYPYGLPNTAWQILLNPLPARWRKPLLDKIVYQGYPDARNLGLKFAPNREDRVGTSAPVRGYELVEGIRSGKIKTVDGLARFDGAYAVLDDGTRLEVDTVIFGTGYRPVLDFLDFAYTLDDDGWHLRLDPHTYQVEGRRGLHVVGWFYRGLGPLHNIRQEAKTVVKAIHESWRRNSPL